VRGREREKRERCVRDLRSMIDEIKCESEKEKKKWWCLHGVEKHGGREREKLNFILILTRP
jgi:hypothetical protein